MPPACRAATSIASCSSSVTSPPTRRLAHAPTVVDRAVAARRRAARYVELDEARRAGRRGPSSATADRVERCSTSSTASDVVGWLWLGWRRARSSWCTTRARRPARGRPTCCRAWSSWPARRARRLLGVGRDPGEPSRSALGGAAGVHVARHEHGAGAGRRDRRPGSAGAAADDARRSSTLPRGRGRGLRRGAGRGRA